MGKLIIVPTPIGNLEDITLRALRVLREVDCILAEDTRTSSKLLKYFEIETSLKSFHKFNEHKRLNSLIEELSQQTTYALISDAGTPGISDPGFLLVRSCIENGIEVECLPGATAFVPALVNSGLPTDKFIFEGFLPQKKGRQTRLKQLAEESRTIVLYESPYRLVKTLAQLQEFFGDRNACVCRELSKLHEENARGTLSELCKYFSEKTVKGEIVLIIGAENKNNNSKKDNAEE